MTKTHTRAPLALLAVLTACKGKPPAQEVHGVTLELFTDDTAKTISLDHPTLLSQLVGPPPAGWVLVRADTNDGRTLELQQPAVTYAGDEVRLYVDNGRAAIGVFPPGALPIVSLTPIASVHVMTHLPSLPPLTVVVAGKDVSLGSDALRSLDTVGERRAQGWPLADLLSLAGASDAVRVRIIGAQEVTLQAAEVAKALIKPNQRGEYVVRVWDEGAKAPTREVRGVTKIVVDGS